MAIEQIRDYRRNLIAFIASVVLAGFGISVLSSLLLSIVNGFVLDSADWALLFFGFISLGISGYLYARSQNLHLNENRLWDTTLRLRMDGGPISDEIGLAFKTGQWAATQAYSELLESSPKASAVGPEMPGLSFSASSSVSFISPPGDRMGPNVSEIFTRELLDYLFMWWLTWLRQDSITQKGKIVNRIEFFQNAELRSYTLNELKGLLGQNRFLDVQPLASEIDVKLPNELSLAVLNGPGLFPKFVIGNDRINIIITYSIIEITRRAESFQTRVRISFYGEPRKIWRINLSSVSKRGDTFASDKYYRSVGELLDNLLTFFPKNRDA